MKCQKCKKEMGTGLREEAEFWITEKDLDLSENEKDDVIMRIIERWDEIADEEIVQIADEIKGCM